jgi:hypothetical protein
MEEVASVWVKKQEYVTPRVDKLKLYKGAK